jgi:hypothetical protein
LFARRPLQVFNPESPEKFAQQEPGYTWNIFDIANLRFLIIFSTGEY